MGSWKLLRQNPSVLGRKLALVIIGSAILTFGIHNIHEVVGITEGGVIGALLLANHWLGVPASIASPILDILCYAFALRLLGVGFLGWSVVSSAAIAAFYALWERLPNMVPDLTALPLAAARSSVESSLESEPVLWCAAAVPPEAMTRWPCLFRSFPVGSSLAAILFPI